VYEVQEAEKQEARAKRKGLSLKRQLNSLFSYSNSSFYLLIYTLLKLISSPHPPHSSCTNYS
jgi:hypothetical protein